MKKRSLVMLNVENAGSDAKSVNSIFLKHAPEISDNLSNLADHVGLLGQLMFLMFLKCADRRGVSGNQRFPETMNSRMDSMILHLSLRAMQ